MVAQISDRERRQKVSLSLDSSTLAYIDAYVAAHPTTNRSRVVDEAIRQFQRQQLDADLERQYEEPESASVQKELDEWRAIRRASASHAARRG